MRIEFDAVDAGPSPQTTVLRQCSLRIEAGEQVAIIGPSGAGKTTFLHLCALALQPQAGALTHNQRDLWALRPAARQRSRSGIFLAPQTPPLPPRQRVVTSVLAAGLARMGFWASLRTLVYPGRLTEVQAALARFDLADKLFERVDHLSGGERQRVALARCLLSPATAWIVDEPLSALDPERARQAVQTLTTAARTQGATLVVSFHQVEVALSHFPRVIGLREGRVLFDRGPAAITAADLQDLYGSGAA